MLPDGTSQAHQTLVAGSQIERVVEATSVDQLLRRVDETLPNIDKVLLSVKNLSEDVRGIVNGPLNSVATKVDALVQLDFFNRYKPNRFASFFRSNSSSPIFLCTSMGGIGTSRRDNAETERKGSELPLRFNWMYSCAGF